MPIAGGTPRKLPGTDGLSLLTWPWATDVPKDATPDRGQTKLVNLSTSEIVDTKTSDKVSGLRCGPDWCGGVSDGNLVIGRPDGSGRQALPGIRTLEGPETLGSGFGLARLLPDGSGIAERKTAAARFTTLVYDPRSGTAGGVGTENGFATGTSSSPTSVVYWDTDQKGALTCRTPPGTVSVPGEKSGASNASGRPPEPPSALQRDKARKPLCAMVPTGGNVEFTVLNLAAVR
ncbi:hypothetical protein AB0395_37260 [Streptosporangium sp. NPDC051023]|uniref:hypothetical protein n=1 Tax=Streptosporangium sp. NPDC051023 TaxID=3155410 RepID=UPI00344E8A89